MAPKPIRSTWCLPRPIVPALVISGRLGPIRWEPATPRLSGTPATAGQSGLEFELPDGVTALLFWCATRRYVTGWRLAGSLSVTRYTA